MLHKALIILVGNMLYRWHEHYTIPTRPDLARGAAPTGVRTGPARLDPTTNRYGIGGESTRREPVAAPPGAWWRPRLAGASLARPPAALECCAVGAVGRLVAPRGRSLWLSRRRLDLPASRPADCRAIWSPLPSGACESPPTPPRLDGAKADPAGDPARCAGDHRLVSRALAGDQKKPARSGARSSG